MHTQTDIKEQNTDSTEAATRADRPSLLAKRNLGNMGGWQERHNTAVMVPKSNERGIVNMIKGWEEYARSLQLRSDTLISEDYVLGPEWQSIGKGILGLLNGETGRLDCGTLDGYIRDTFMFYGYNEEGDLPA